MRLFALPLILVFYFLTAPFTVSLADESAPFGLTWGVSTAKLEASGVKLSQRPPDASGQRFAATNLPKALTDLQEVILSFGSDGRLHKVEAISNDFRHDLDGKRLKARYAALSRALAAKYGNGEVHHQISEPWTRPIDFLIGIHLGSSTYYTNFASKGVTVRLEIRASRRDVGRYALVFQYKEPSRDNDLSREKDVL